MTTLACHGLSLTAVDNAVAANRPQDEIAPGNPNLKSDDLTPNPA